MPDAPDNLIVVACLHGAPSDTRVDDLHHGAGATRGALEAPGPIGRATTGMGSGRDAARRVAFLTHAVVRDGGTSRGEIAPDAASKGTMELTPERVRIANRIVTVGTGERAFGHARGARSDHRSDAVRSAPVLVAAQDRPLG